MTSRIPSNAKKVFQGKIFEVWQWEQQMFDGSVKIFEKLKRPNTVQVIPVVGDKILIQVEEQPHRKQPYLSIPGGRMEKGEIPLTAAKRELLEETDYVSSDWILWTEISPITKIDWTVFTYIARNCILKKSPELDAGEKIQVRLVDFEEFMKTTTEDLLFYGPEIVPDLLRLQLNLNKKEKFYRLLFSKK